MHWQAAGPPAPPGGWHLELVHVAVGLERSHEPDPGQIGFAEVSTKHGALRLTRVLRPRLTSAF